VQKNKKKKQKKTLSLKPVVEIQLSGLVQGMKECERGEKTQERGKENQCL